MKQRVLVPIVVCKHCFKRVGDKPCRLRVHLRNFHDIMGLTVKQIRHHFCQESEVESLKIAYARKHKRIENIARKRAEKAERRKAEIAEYRKSWMGENPAPVEKDFRCGDVVNGGSFVRIIYTAMGGSNKKY